MGRVAVITGASSGIGHALAIALARQGANVVLGARRIALLEAVAEQCREYGVRALAVETDVTDQDQVDRLGQAAVDEFGGYDVWINNAGVTLLGCFTSLSPDMFRRVLETNFFGCAYGAWTALRQFEARERGILINMSSLFGTIPTPYESPYVASKFALTGFSASLRQELRLMGLSDVHVCTVSPAAIDTPMYRNAANATGRMVQPPGPLYSVDAVVAAVLRLMDEPRPEVAVGRAGQGTTLLYRLLPATVFERWFGKYIEFSHFTHKQAPVLPGNIFEPGEYGGTSGGWSKPLLQRKQLYWIAAGAAAGMLGLLWYARSRQRSQRTSDE